MTARNWRTRGACWDDHALGRIMVRPDRPSNESIARGVAVCATCSVRYDCLDFAAENRPDYGIWGALDARRIRRLRSRPDALRAASDAAVAEARQNLVGTRGSRSRREENRR